MNHDGDIKKIMFLIEELNSVTEENPMLDLTQDKEKVDVVQKLKDCVFKLQSYNVLDGSNDFKEGFLSGIMLSVEMIENIISRIEE